MRGFATAGTLVFLVAWAAAPAVAGAIRIDLRTRQGVEAVKGQWRYSDARIVEVDHKGPDGKPNRTYNIEPKAFGANFDDGLWAVVAPESLKDRRSTGLVCFCWYRIKITLPKEAAGKSAFFQTTVDDYGEVWVDGKLPRKAGQTGGSVVAGFNAPNRVELNDPRPGKVYQVSVFGMNGPISAAPNNYIFLGETFLELVEKR